MDWATGWEGEEIVVDFAAGSRDFSSLQRVQTGSYLVGNGVSFPGNKVAGANYHLISRLRLSGAIIPLPSSTLMACTETSALYGNQYSV